MEEPSTLATLDAVAKKKQTQNPLATKTLNIFLPFTERKRSKETECEPTQSRRTLLADALVLLEYYGVFYTLRSGYLENGVVIGMDHYQLLVVFVGFLEMQLIFIG